MAYLTRNTTPWQHLIRMTTTGLFTTAMLAPASHAAAQSAPPPLPTAPVTTVNGAPQADPWNPPLQVHPLCVDECKESGRCSQDGDECVAVDPVQCQRSTQCYEAGQCALQQGACRAARWQHCLSARECTTDGRCFLTTHSGTCDNERRDKPAMVVGIVALSLAAAGGMLGSLMLATGTGTTDIVHGSFATAGLGLASGIPLIVWGAPQSSRDDAVVRAGFGASGVMLEASF